MITPLRINGRGGHSTTKEKVLFTYSIEMYLLMSFVNTYEFFN